MKGREHIGDDTVADIPVNGSEQTAETEETIDQVRNLLFGRAQRSIESRLDDLREEMETSLKQLRSELSNELTAVQAKLLELERSTEEKQRTSQKDLQKQIGSAISELGATISELGRKGS